MTTRVDMNHRIYRLSPRVIGALTALVEHLQRLREPAQYDDLDPDDKGADIGAERPPSWEEESDAACWCIRKTREMSAI